MFARDFFSLISEFTYFREENNQTIVWIVKIRFIDAVTLCVHACVFVCVCVYVCVCVCVCVCVYNWFLSAENS